MNDQLRLGIRQHEETDPGNPQHPPGDVMSAEAIGEPSTKSAKRSSGQREASRKYRGLRNGETVFTFKIIRHPHGKSSKAAEDDRVVLTVLPDTGVLQNRKLADNRLRCCSACAGVWRGKKPKQTRRSQKSDRVHSRHGLPAIIADQRRRDKHVQSRSDSPGSEDAHCKATTLFRKETRHVRCSDGERGSHKTKRQSKQ